MYLAPLDDPVKTIPIRMSQIAVSFLFNMEVPKLIPAPQFHLEDLANNQDRIFNEAEQEAQNVRPIRRKKRRRRGIRRRGRFGRR